MTDAETAQDPEEQRRRRHNFFYRDGTPETAQALLTAFVGEMASALAAGDESAQATFVSGVVYFARAAERRPEIVRAYEAVARTVPVEHSPVVLRLLAHAGDAATSEFLRAFAADPSNEAVAGLVAELLRRGVGPDPDLVAAASEPITGPQHLDLRWMQFMATGDAAKVDEIVAVLAWPDRLRAHLEGLLAPRTGLRALFGGNSRAAAIMRALAPLGLRFDPTTHAIRNLVDVDMFVTNDRGRPDAARCKVFFDAMPTKLPPELVIAAATKSSAAWSLTANACEHEPVLAACEAALARASAAPRLALLEIVARVYEQRGELAKAERAWTSFRALEPEHVGVDEAIEALALERRFAAIEADAGEGARALAPDEREAAARACAGRLARTPGYHVRGTSRRFGAAIEDGQLVRSDWRGQHVGGDRTRMSRAYWTHASEEGLADEWIDIGADHYVLGPGIVLKAPPAFGEWAAEDAITRNDRFAALLRTRAPDHGVARTGDGSIVVYEAAEVGDLSFLGVGDGPLRVTLTIDPQHWLARAEVASPAGAGPGFTLLLRFVAPERPITIEAPAGAIDMKDAKRVKRPR